jgi:hypothetical protein
MRLLIPGVAALIFAASAAAGPPFPPGRLYDGWDPATPGGFKIFSKDGTTITSYGGFLIPRHDRIQEPDGTITRFRYPSEFVAPPDMTEPRCARGFAEVHIPDERGLLYVNDEPEPLRGPVLDVRTPFLKRGECYALHLRAAFRAGDDLLIQDQAVTIQGGETRVVRFGGASAIRVPLRPRGEMLPSPRELPAKE